MPIPMPNGCEAVLLDLDGTLVDSLDDLTDAVNALLAEEGLPGIDRVRTRAMVGDGAGKLVERALRANGGDAGTAPALVPRFLAVYAPVATRRTRAFPGVAPALQTLACAGIALAVVTNKPEAVARTILADLGLDACIAVVVGGDTLQQRKPAPEPLHAALSRLGPSWSGTTAKTSRPPVRPACAQSSYPTATATGPSPSSGPTPSSTSSRSSRPCAGCGDRGSNSGLEFRAWPRCGP
ncbi:Phosphoglycolate phosphatase [Methylobacterium soli]|nr:Phosphoglycolate phosphatase [Methylobacterium soli]